MVPLAYRVRGARSTYEVKAAKRCLHQPATMRWTWLGYVYLAASVHASSIGE